MLTALLAISINYLKALMSYQMHSKETGSTGYDPY